MVGRVPGSRMYVFGLENEADSWPAAASLVN
jgi:hypothetical protein